MEPTCCDEVIEVPFDKCSSRGVEDVPGVVRERGGVFDVPVHGAVGAGVVEIFEGKIEPAEGPADAFEKTGRAFAAMDQRRPVKIGDQTGPAHPAFHLQRQDRLPLTGGEDPRHELGHRCGGEVIERLDLALDHLPVVTGRCHLEHQAVAACGHEDEVAVDLAGQRLGAAVDAPVLAGNLLRNLGRERGVFYHSGISFMPARSMDPPTIGGAAMPLEKRAFRPCLQGGVMFRFSTKRP